MITVHVQVKNEKGDELEAHDVQGKSPWVWNVAMAWGRGQLQRSEPGTYVQYTATETKR